MSTSAHPPESRAFGAVWAALIVIGLAVAAGVLIGGGAGIAVLFLGIAGGVWWAAEHRAPRHDLRDAEEQGHATAAGAARPARRVLLVANEALDDDALTEAIGDPAAPVAVDVLAPVLQSRTHLLMTDADAERAAARERLEATLSRAHQRGIDAVGEVGDAVDPMRSLRDELARGDVSEVVVATHPEHRENWLEPIMLDELRSQLGVPVRQVVVRPGRSAPR